MSLYPVFTAVLVALILISLLYFRKSDPEKDERLILKIVPILVIVGVALEIIQLLNSGEVISNTSLFALIVVLIVLFFSRPKTDLGKQCRKWFLPTGIVILAIDAVVKFLK